MKGMGASQLGDERGRESIPQEFYAEVGEISLALEMLAFCKSSVTPKRIYAKAISCYEIPLRTLEKAEYAQEFARLANSNTVAVRACSLKIVDLLLFNTDNDPFLSLGLSRNATEDEIHRRWKRLLVLFHPDRPAPGMLNVTRTKMINAAYQSIRKLLLEHSTAMPGAHSEYSRGKVRASSGKKEIASPANRALDDALRTCVKYFWRALYAINVLAGSVTSPKRLRRLKKDTDYLKFIPSVIVLLTAVAALVMFSLYIIHSLFSLVGRIAFG